MFHDTICISLLAASRAPSQSIVILLVLLLVIDPGFDYDHEQEHE